MFLSARMRQSRRKPEMKRIISALLICLLSAPLLVGAEDAPVALNPQAPDSHRVVPGDTLWGIAGRFLANPWQWPQVWQMNREQIANPHLIYPGQIIHLDRNGPWLRIGMAVSDERRTPTIYHSPLEQAALTTIPVDVIQPFLVMPLVVDSRQIDDAGRIIATEGQRVMTGSGEKVFAIDLPVIAGEWQVFRQAEPLTDPDTGEVLAFEARHLGLARMQTQGEFGGASTLEVVTAVEEISAGDLLRPSERPEIFAYVPRRPSFEIEAKVMAIPRGVLETGRHNVFIINRGDMDGLQVGHVLSLWRDRGSATFEGRQYPLPEERFGLGFVFRVFDRVAYVLAMDANGPIKVGDTLRQP